MPDEPKIDSPITYQEVLRQFLDARAETLKPGELATQLGVSVTTVDNLLRGYTFEKDRKTGKRKRQERYISFEHIEALARHDGVKLQDMLKEVYVAVALLENERIAEREISASSGADAARPRPPARQ